MNTKKPNPRLFLNVAADVLKAARSEMYPVIINRRCGPDVVLAVTSAMVRLAISRTDAGSDLVLHSCEEIIVHGLANGALSAREALLANETLLLARPGHGSEANTAETLAQLYDKAEELAATYDLCDALGLISVAAQLLQFVETLQPGVLAQLAEWVDMQQWVGRVTEQLYNTTTLEEL